MLVAAWETPDVFRRRASMIICILAIWFFSFYIWSNLRPAARGELASTRGWRRPRTSLSAGTISIPGDELVDASQYSLAWTALDDHQLNRLLTQAAP
jgi:hypothetical protein